MLLVKQKVKKIKYQIKGNKNLNKAYEVKYKIQ